MRAIPSPVMSAEQPMSRTMQYKKVMKPLLERKRRARINQCLEELKELMVTAIQAEGENVSKLEKADVLELTVAHLRKLNESRQQQEPAPVDPATAVRRFHAGFARCVQEVDTFFDSQPAGHPAARGLVSHLHDCLTVMDAADKTQPIRVAAPTPSSVATPVAPYQKALHHLRVQQQQGLLMPVRVLVRDDKPVASPVGSVSSSMAYSCMESEDESMSTSMLNTPSNSGLDLRVKKESYSSAMSSCYDSSDEDVWRPW